MEKIDYKHIGISTNLFNNPENLVKTVSFLAQYFLVIELELEHGARQILSAGASEYDRTLKKLNQLRTSNHLDLSVHSPYIGAECNLAANDEDTREVSCKLLRRTIEFCGDLEINYLTYHPGYKSTDSLDLMIDNLKRSLEKLVPQAAALGVKLCMENTGAERPKFLVFSPAQYVGISQETGSYLTLDLIHHASHFSNNGRLNNEFFEAIEEMLPCIRNIHVADIIIPKHVHLPLGTGNLPIAKLLDFLAIKQYHGNVIIEEIGGGYSCTQFFTAAREYRDRYCDR